MEDLQTLTDLYDGRVYDLRNTTLEEVFNNENEESIFQEIGLQDFTFEEISEDEENQYPFQGNLPVPTIESLDNDGLLTIKFNKPLKVPDDISVIEESEVALRFM